MIEEQIRLAMGQFLSGGPGTMTESIQYQHGNTTVSVNASVSIKGERDYEQFGNAFTAFVAEITMPDSVIEPTVGDFIYTADGQKWTIDEILPPVPGAYNVNVRKLNAKA